MKGKRMIALILAVLLLAALTGCSGKGKDKTVTTGDVGVVKDTEFGNIYLDLTIEEFNKKGFAFGDSIDVTFSNGYTLEEGLTTPNPYEAEMKRTIISRCRECFLTADSRKYGTVYMSKVADIGELDGIITDDELPKNVARNMQEHGIHLY